MEKRFYYVSIGYCGSALRTAGNQKYGYGIRGRANKVVPIYCSEEELDAVAMAVGQGYLADSCSVALTEEEAWNCFCKHYAVYWDCM